MIRPLVFGYAQATRTSSGLPRREASLRTTLDAFADREGFAVAQLFVDIAGGPRLMALESLIEAASFTVIAAVVVPSWTHLGSDEATQHRTQKLIGQAAGVPVLSVTIASSPATERARNDAGAIR